MWSRLTCASRACSLPDELLRFILGRIEHFPEAVFWESELRAISDQEFEQLKNEKLLRFVQTDLDEAAYPCPTAVAECTDRVLMQQAGKLLAVCPCPAAASVIELLPSDIRRFRVDLLELGERFQLANGFTGTPSALEDRLFLLGQMEEEGMSTAFVLAFLADEREGLPLLRQLPLLLSGLRGGRFCVVCPSFEPSVQARRELQTLHVDVVPLGRDNPTRLEPEVSRVTSPSEVDPKTRVRAMQDILQSWQSGRRRGAAEALVHIIDHVPLPDHAAAARVVGDLGYPLDRGRMDQLLHDGRKRLDKAGVTCTFCRQTRHFG
jgi:hypothetical protein